MRLLFVGEAWGGTSSAVAASQQTASAHRQLKRHLVQNQGTPVGKGQLLTIDGQLRHEYFVMKKKRGEGAADVTYKVPKCVFQCVKWARIDINDLRRKTEVFKGLVHALPRSQWGSTGSQRCADIKPRVGSLTSAFLLSIE